MTSRLRCKRREFITLLGGGAVVWPLAARAQQPAMYRIGVISPGSAPPGLLEAFQQGLRELGYVEGTHVAFEWRFADGNNERLPGLADELVRRKVDVIFAVNTPAAVAAKKATKVIPIVIARLADPVKTGLVSSISRPGGNITGLSSITEELAAKRLQLLKEVLPRVSRVAILWNAGNPGHVHVVEAMDHASRQLGLRLLSAPVRGEADLGVVFAAASQGLADALVVVDDVLITTHRTQILALAAKRALPVVASYREFAEAGALIAYAHSVRDEYHRAAYYVDRILRGTKPGDQPIEQPTRFVLIINLKTAKALRLEVPPMLIARADEVIE